MNMGEVAITRKYTIQSYLELEKKSKEKFEFHDGNVLAMAGGSPDHSLISANITAELRSLLKSNKGTCKAYNSDVKVAVEEAGRYYYPDASVVCGETLLSALNPQAIVNPLLIVEVLSESTERFDRGEKFFYYRQIPSLKEYLVVSQNQPIAEVYYRENENVWQFRTVIGLENTISLQSISGEILMKEVYHNVKDLNLIP